MAFGAKVLSASLQFDVKHQMKYFSATTINCIGVLLKMTLRAKNLQLYLMIRKRFYTKY